MNRNLLIFIILLFLLSTVLVCVFRPKTHKPIAFEDRSFKLELISDEVAAPKNPELNISQNNADFSAPQIDINVPSVNVSTPSLNVNIPQTDNKSLKVDSKNNTNINNQPKNQPKTSLNQQKTQIVSKNNQQNQKAQPKVTEPNLPETKTAQKTTKPNVSQPVEKINEKSVQKTAPVKVLTEEEEIIAWNKWRSDLQNKLMRDSKIAAPIGTSFEFSFTVDKFGTISNLKTWSSNPSYTPLAVRVIKPLLLSYQKTAILNFPTGSKRVITNVNGGFTMAHSSRFSSPADYNDYERVTK